MGGKIGDIAVDDVVNTDFFKFSVDKDSNGKLVKKISVTDDKRLGSFERAAYLKIELNDMTDTDEAKSDGTIEFKAKADYTSYADKKSKPKTAAPGTWSKDDTLKIVTPSGSAISHSITTTTRMSAIASTWIPTRTTPTP